MLRIPYFQDGQAYSIADLNRLVDAVNAVIDARLSPSLSDGLATAANRVDLNEELDARLTCSGSDGSWGWVEVVLQPGGTWADKVPGRRGYFMPPGESHLTGADSGSATCAVMQSGTGAESGSGIATDTPVWPAYERNGAVPEAGRIVRLTPSGWDETLGVMWAFDIGGEGGEEICVLTDAACAGGTFTTTRRLVRVLADLGDCP